MAAKALARTLLCAAAALAAACLDSGRVADGGTGTETTTGVAAALVRSDGTPAARARVRLRTADYLAGSATGPSLDTVTDSTGRFRLIGLRPGDYAIEAGEGGTAILFSCRLDGGAVRDLGVGRLQPCASLAGRAEGLPAPAEARLYGLERRARLDSAGRFRFDSLPPAALRLRVDAAIPGARPLEQADIRIAPGAVDSARLERDWPFSRRIYLNTSATGAGVPEDVIHFPLLLRLDSAAGVFGTALAGGSDLRFAAADGRDLPSEVESWDGAAGRALVWVRVDTVRGGDDRQFLLMRWGNPAVTPGAGRVFDPADGFAAAWHLDSTTDASGQVAPGEALGARATTGVVGGAYAFDGASSYLRMPASPSLDLGGKGLTAVFWQRADAPFGSERVFFEHGVWPDTGCYSVSAYNDSILSFDFPDARQQVRGWGGSNTGGAWTHVAVTFDDGADTGRIYRNGALVAADTMRSPLAHGDRPAFIGSRGGVERFFRGDLDEMWILDRAMPAAWLRLLYESQRPDQALVGFR